MAKIDKEYHKLINVILSDGFTYEDPNRKGVNRIQIPSYRLEHKFEDGFPAMTTKKLYWKGIVGELLWFLRGDTDIKYLLENNINIWNEDAYKHYWNSKYVNENPFEFKYWLEQLKSENPQDHDGKITGSLGRIYGAQWRNWGVEIPFGEATSSLDVGTDQIYNLIKGLKETPMGTRHMVTAWNPDELDNMALPPCHWSFEILVEPIGFIERWRLSPNEYNPNIKELNSSETCEHKHLDLINIPKYKFTLKWHQRSVDTFLGLPFNIASYALLAQIIGKMTNMIPKGIEGDLSNVHLYEPHLKAVEKQLNRNINEYDPCQLTMLDEFHYLTDKELVGNLSVNEIINNLRIDMFKLKDYKSYPAIKAKMLPYSS